MTACHLANILTYMVGAGSKSSSHFWNIFHLAWWSKNRIFSFHWKWWLIPIHSLSRELQQRRLLMCTFTILSSAVVFYRAMQHLSLSSVMISRLILNLRDPSLLLNGRRASFNTPTAELTYPITTNIVAQASEETSYVGLAPSQPCPSHTMYY